MNDVKNLKERALLNLSAHFNGQSSFNNKKTKQMNRNEFKFGFKAKNTTDKDLKVVLFPGSFGNNIEEIQDVYREADVVIDDGTLSIVGLTGDVSFRSKETKTIAHLLRFADRAAMELVGLDIQSRTKSNLQQVIKFGETAPFDMPALRSLHLSEYVSTMQNDTDRCVINLYQGGKKIPVMANTFLYFEICANSEIEIDLTFLA